MTVKKIHYLLIALLGIAITSCEKDPDTTDLHRDYLVYTASDPATNFTDLGSYFMPDSILLITKSEKTEYWKDADAQAVIKAMSDNLAARNFTRTDDKTLAEIGIQMSYVKHVTHFVGYDNPYWWWYYPYYWSPGYWGDWMGWHYPYPVAVYSYAEGSLLIEMVNLTATPGEGKKLPIIWDSFITGLLSESSALNLQRTVAAVNQAFEQSPNVKR